MRILVVLLAVMALSGCSDGRKAKEVLESNGYKDIQITGWKFWGCGKDDSFTTGFKAVSSSGQKVKGVVCSDWFKGATIRQ